MLMHEVKLERSEDDGGRRKRRSRWGDKALSFPPPTVIMGPTPTLSHVPIPQIPIMSPGPSGPGTY